MKKPKKSKNSSERAKKLGEKRQIRAKVAHVKKIKKKEAIRLDKIKKEENFREYMNNLMGK
jgi:hypothetical protein